MSTYPIVELLGDGISAELSASVHTVADALPFTLAFQPVDLSDEARRREGRALFDEAERCIRDVGTAIKYPTATTEESPNRILRARLGFHVIHRPVCTIPGITTNFTRSIDGARAVAGVVEDSSPSGDSACGSSARNTTAVARSGR